MRTNGRSAWMICVIALFAGLGGSYAAGIEPTGAAPVTEKAPGVAEKGATKDKSKLPPRVFDVMFKNFADKHTFMPYSEYTDMFAGGVFLTNDKNIASKRAIDAHSICKDLLVLLQRYSPRSDRFKERLGKKEIRQRTLLCASTNEARAKKGSYDEVGDFVVVKEQRPAHFDEGPHKVQGSNLDAIWVYILIEPLYKDGELPKDITQNITRDVGGYLFANADYFVNADEEHPVDKADKKAVKEATRKYMTGIWDHMQAMLELEHGWDRIEGVLKDHYEFFEDEVKRD